MKVFASPFFWPLYSWMFVSAAYPTATGNFDFVHVSDDKALTVSVSKNSPPMAAIADESLPSVVMEPLQPLKVGKKTRVLVSGVYAWPKLKKYSDAFEKQRLRHLQMLRMSEAREKARQMREAQRTAALVKVVGPVTSALHVSEANTRKDKISELMSLVQPVHYQYVQGPEIHIAAGGEYKWAPDPNQPAVQTPSHEIERSLPKGEETAPIVITPSGSDKGRSAQSALPFEFSKPGGRLTVSNSNSSPNSASQPRQVASVTPKALTGNESTGIMALDGGSAADYSIVGQVELSGGLAVAKDMNSLDIQWKTGLQTINGLVDISTGKFLIRTPMVNAGKVIATVTDADRKVIGRGEFDLDGSDPTSLKTLEGIKIVIEPIEGNKGGEIYSAYSYGDVKIPVPGAEVFAAAQNRETVDGHGQFKMPGLNADSTYVLESYAPENWATRIITEARQHTKVPMFSNKMIQSLFDLVGEPLNTDYAIVWGEAKRRGKSVEGVEVALTGSDFVGPIYFNEFRIPDRSLKQTSSNGLFAFMRVSPGLHVVMARKQNHELPGVVVSAAPGIVSYAEMNLKAIELVGQVYDPIFKHPVDAKLSVVGTNYTAQTNSGKFNFKIPSTDGVIFISAHPENDYLVSREAVARSSAKNINLLAFRKDWLAQQMTESQIKQQDSRGMLLGYIQGPVFHVELDKEQIAEQDISYFNGAGKIEAGRMDSGSDGGAFLITNIKPGLHTLVITTADGQITNSRVFVSEAGVLNVLTGNLNP